MAHMTCAACPHLRTAHTVPDGHCQLCPCPGWTPHPTDRKDLLMADIGQPQREVTFEPLEVPEPVTVPDPDRELVPA